VKIRLLLIRAIRYLYALFMAVDANFRLKHKARNLPDVELAPGWAYYVSEPEYKAYYQARSNDKEV
jgi:hypothetical protein